MERDQRRPDNPAERRDADPGGRGVQTLTGGNADPDGRRDADPDGRGDPEARAGADDLPGLRHHRHDTAATILLRDTPDGAIPQ
ncbi:MAG: hypothetical protein ACLUN5_02575 [Oscillospiraceae bacterium]